MAIIVEEKENKNGLFAIIGWVIFLAIAGAAVYYVFFAKPELITIPASDNIAKIAPIANLALHPETVVQGAAFQSLISSITAPSPQGPASVGRTNPFIAP